MTGLKDGTVKSRLARARLKLKKILTESGTLSPVRRPNIQKGGCSTVTCEDALALLSGHLDGENTQEEEQALLAHLEVCDECRALLEAFEEADAGVLALEAEPPRELRGQIMEKVRRESARPQEACEALGSADCGRGCCGGRPAGDRDFVSAAVPICRRFVGEHHCQPCQS